MLCELFVKMLNVVCKRSFRLQRHPSRNPELPDDHHFIYDWLESLCDQIKEMQEELEKWRRMPSNLQEAIIFFANDKRGSDLQLKERKTQGD